MIICGHCLQQGNGILQLPNRFGGIFSQTLVFVVCRYVLQVVDADGTQSAQRRDGRLSRLGLTSDHHFA